MRRTEFLLELIRTRYTAAIVTLIALVIVGSILGNRRSTWIVVVLGLLAVTLGYVLSGHNNN
jgi:1,4-dihydroxy-2-naphthoate octaprenyltransferase